MEESKGKRGRPVGGNAPKEIREYWRRVQAEYRKRMRAMQGRKKK